jgi:hypothetical protein
MRAIGLCTFALLALLLFWLGVENQKVLCVKRWEESGTPAKWKKDVGCMVEKRSGSWVPENFMRPIK